MGQNNHFIWYLPYYFLMFFSIYLGLKFVFIFFFMTAYVPLFIFDFTPFFILNGVEYTHLLFLAFTTVFIDMYLHVVISKKHSLYSLILTSILICGMGVRIATVPLSMTFIIQYIIFSLLLLILVIDHRLYLIMPHEFTKISGSVQENIKPLPLPAFSTTKPIPTQVKNNSIIKPTLSSFKQLIHTLNLSLHQLLKFRSAQPTTELNASIPHLENSVSKIPHLFKHPIEAESDKIKSTQQLLGTIENYESHFNNLDKSIENTKLSNIKKTDFSDQIPRTVSFNESLDEDKYSKVLKNINESAVVISRGVVKAVNHSFTDMIGRPITDILDHNFIEFVAPEGFQKYKSHYLQKLGGESSTSFPIVLQSKKMDKIFLNASVKKLMIKETNIEVTIFINQDT